MTRIEDSGRLTKAGRRAQLLDVAGALVADDGTDGFTMEGLAERAGVSKALPYRHFDNADDVLVALYQREMTLLARRVTARLQLDQSYEGRARSIVRAYFDAVADRSALLSVLAGPGSAVPARADGATRESVRFAARVLAEVFDLDEHTATTRAATVLGALTGVVNAWQHRDGSRRELEDLAVTLLLAAAGRS